MTEMVNKFPVKRGCNIHHCDKNTFYHGT